MRLLLSIVLSMLLPLVAITAEKAPGETAIKTLLTKHKNWTMYWELTGALLPSERAHKLNYEFFERDQKLMGRLIFAYGGCDFHVALRPDGISLRYCVLDGEPSLTFDPSDAKYPFKQRNNPRKLWLTPTSQLPQ